MNISIFGLSITTEMLILIGVVYLILVVNTLHGCCNTYGMIEGFEAGGIMGGADAIVKDAAKQMGGILREGNTVKKIVKNGQTGY